MICIKNILSLAVLNLSFTSMILFAPLTELLAEEDHSMHNSEKLRTQLSARHLTYSRQSLVELMGSEDALVEGLLMLRRESKPPGLGVRAEKLLIGFSSREDVKVALLADVEDPEYFGLGSVVVASLGQIEDREFRKIIAKESLGSSKLKNNHQSRYKLIIEQLDPNLLK